MILNKATSIYGNPVSNTIDYYNGSANTLEVENFDLFWKFLLYIEQDRTLGDIRSWYKQHGEQGADEVIDFLVSENIVVNSDLLKSISKSRYHNYFLAYKNGDEMLEKMNRIKIMIIGIGTIGATLAMSLAKMGVKNIELIDVDNVEIHNINAQFVYCKNDVGKKKTETVIRKLQECVDDNQFMYHELFIDQSTIDSFTKIIKTSKPDVVFSCFDEAAYDIHNKIYEATKSYNGNYVLNGYVNDVVLSLDLKNDQFKDKMLNPLRTFDFNYRFSVNRGIITQSLCGSIINCNRILQYAEKGTLGNAYISINTKNMEIIQKDTQLSMPTSHSLSHLKSHYNLDNIINLLEHLKDGSTKDNEEYLTNKIIEIYNMVEILDAIGDDSWSQLCEMLNRFIEEEDDSNYLWKMNQIHAQYSEIIDGLYLEEHNIFDKLASINYEKDIEKRVLIQRSVFKEIELHANKILSLLKEAKLLYHNHPNHTEEIYGIKIDSLKQFYNSMHNGIGNMARSLYGLMFPDIKVDLLYTIDKNEQFRINFDESLLMVSSLFDDFSRSSHLHLDIASHIRDTLSPSYIFNIKGVRVYNTYYLPSINRSVIIIDHTDTMLSTLLLVHEIGHSYFSCFYGKNFYNTSNIVVNEALAHFFEIVFVNLILSSKKHNHNFKNGIVFEYLNRVNKNIISALFSEKLEDDVIQHLLKNKELTIEKFLQLNTIDNIEDIEVVHQEFSRLNILIYPPFITSYKDFSMSALSYLMAIAMYEIYKDNLNMFLYRVEQNLRKKDTNLDMFVLDLFDEKLNEGFYEILSTHYYCHIKEIKRKV